MKKSIIAQRIGMSCVARKRAFVVGHSSCYTFKCINARQGFSVAEIKGSKMRDKITTPCVSARCDWSRRPRLQSASTQSASMCTARSRAASGGKRRLVRQRHDKKHINDEHCKFSSMGLGNSAEVLPACSQLVECTMHVHLITHLAWRESLPSSSEGELLSCTSLVLKHPSPSAEMALFDVFAARRSHATILRSACGSRRKRAVISFTLKQHTIHV